MHNSYDRLAQLLCEVPEYAVEGRLNKNIVAELARKYDTGLINKLLSDKDMKKLFFSESDAGLIFKKDIFLQFISQKEFLPDSYTAFEQKIGLASGGTMLRNDDRVVLNWPYKDCVLEGGQTREDAKRDEVFFNEILAPDEISTILDDKVFTNWRRYDKDGEHKLDKLKLNDNLIIMGNNLIVLHSLLKRFSGKIKLIYIDVPFNTKNDSFGYNDTFSHSTWLTFMKNRLEVAKKLLSEDGSIVIHADWHEAHYVKVLADEIFGRENFINEIIWCYTGPGSPGMKQFNRKHDNLFWYEKTANMHIFNSDSIRVESEVHSGGFNNAMKASDSQDYEKKGKIPEDWWEFAVAARIKADGIKRTGYLTEKPYKLMDRIISAMTNPGDIVLDFFAGSGTTLYSAANLNRQYIGIEQLADTQQLMIKRMSQISNFVYCNIKNDANIFREKVQHADDKKMDDLLDEVLHSSFLSYRIDAKNHNIKLGDFHKLSLADKKHVLLDLIDNNTLYLNYSEIDDATYKISDEDKKHNKAFYGE